MVLTHKTQGVDGLRTPPKDADIVQRPLRRETHLSHFTTLVWNSQGIVLYCIALHCIAFID